MSFKIGDKVLIEDTTWILSTYDTFAKVHNLTKYNRNYKYPENGAVYGVCEVVALDVSSVFACFGVYSSVLDLDLVVVEPGLKLYKDEDSIIEVSDFYNTICRHCGRPAFKSLFSIDCDCEQNKRGDL